MPSILSKFIYISCHEAAHTWSDSCTRSSADVFIECLKYALSLYTPLYTVTAFLNKKGKKYFMKKFFIEILQSTMFLSCNGFFMILFFCFLRKLFGGIYPWSAGILPGFLSSFCAILIERKSRRGALAIYMLNQAFDTLFNMLKHSGYARDVKYGEVIIFSASLSALMLMYRTENLPDGFIKTLIKRGDVTELRKSSMHSKYTPDYLIHTELSLKSAGTVFFAGYGLQAVYQLLTSITKLTKSPGLITKILFSSDHLQLGAFLGSLVFLYNMTEMLLQKANKQGKALNAAVAGAVAGSSMFFQKSSYVSLYTLSKTLELLYMNGIKKGVFPYFKHFDTLLYAVCTGIMFHGAVLQPTYLKPTYWNFLVKLTGRRFLEIDRTKWDVFGYDSSLKNEIKKR